MTTSQQIFKVARKTAAILAKANGGVSVATSTLPSTPCLEAPRPAHALASRLFAAGAYAYLSMPQQHNNQQQVGGRLGIV